MSKFYSVDGIVNLSYKGVTSNVFSLFQTKGANFSRTMFPICLRVLCVFYILDRKIANLQFYRLTTFSDYPRY